MNKALWMATTVMAMIALAACAGPTATPAPTPTPAAVATPTPALGATPTPAVVATPRPTPTATPRPAPTPTPLGRQEALVAAARKEGAVSYWATTGETAPKYLAKFKERYPFLDIKIWDATDTDIATKITLEAKAGRHSVDVIGIAPESTVELKETGLLAKYEWPNTANWPRQYTQLGEGFYVDNVITPMGPVYNSKLVPLAEAPKSWDDMKNPKWKGKAGATNSADEAPLAVAFLLGRDGKLDWDRSFAFWREVFENIKPRTMSGYTGPTTLLGAGEFQLLVYGSIARAMERQVNFNLPVSAAPVDRIAVKGSPLSIVKDTPHPNAARLLADYLTSTEGQIEFSKHMIRPVIDPAAAPQALGNRMLSELGIKTEMMPPAVFTSENVKKSTDYWREMLGIR